MNAIDLLKQQHREVEKLFERISKATGKEKERIFYDLADALAIHTTIEERIFYPRSRTEDTEEILDESVQEHLQAKRILADMLDMDVSDAEFDGKCKVLKEEVEHHVEEEESELFPAVRKEMQPDELADIGEEMETLEEELRTEGEPRQHVPDEIGTASPL